MKNKFFGINTYSFESVAGYMTESDADQAADDVLKTLK